MLVGCHGEHSFDMLCDFYEIKRQHGTRTGKEVVAWWGSGLVSDRLYGGVDPSPGPVPGHCRSELPPDRKGATGLTRARQEPTAKGTAAIPASVRSQLRERSAANDRRHHALSLCRPLNRRERSTARPPRVALRARKPCLRARFRLFGWKVLLGTGTPRTSVESRRA